MNELNVLYEDNHIIVVEKPVNIPAQADSSGDSDMLTLIKSYIKQKYNKPGDVFLGLVHRLDRPVGGVMVFARTSKAASRLAPQFASHRAKKRYAAIVTDSPKAYAKLEDYIRKDESTLSAVICPPSAPGAKNAALEYYRLTERGGLTLWTCPSSRGGTIRSVRSLQTQAIQFGAISAITPPQKRGSRLHCGHIRSR